MNKIYKLILHTVIIYKNQSQPEIYLSARAALRFFRYSRLFKILGHVGKLTTGYCIEKNNSKIVTVFSSPFRHADNVLYDLYPE
ncbi:hypothetical protein RCL_jg16868.t1 [Rhizophagus clarus]|uniref:Uncharacterized protein n=1 Tax=Rhizophagus clarus TaxID=94130 RepID=A0A8H3QL54_9GLOM|nr:hypothetical protein RCL_jg16868.t1 [Rhizophagus clarus]